MRLGRLGLLLAASAIAPCLAFADPITFYFEPEAGATWKVTEIHTKASSNPAKPNGEGVITATLKVIKVTDDGYLMEWTTNTVTAGGQTLGAGGAAQPELLIGVPLRYTADTSGTPIEIIDLSGMLDRIGGTIGTTKDPAAKEKFMKFLNSIDSATLANTLLQEAAVFGQCHNFQLDPAAPLKTQTNTDSPIGGPPILTNVSITLESVGSAKDPARIVVSQIQDPQSAATSMMEAIRKIGGEKAVNNALVDGKMPLVHNSSTVTCNIDTTRGEAVNIITDVNVKTGATTMRDTRKLTFQRQ